MDWVEFWLIAVLVFLVVVVAIPVAIGLFGTMYDHTEYGRVLEISEPYIYTVTETHNRVQSMGNTIIMIPETNTSSSRVADISVGLDSGAAVTMRVPAGDRLNYHDGQCVAADFNRAGGVYKFGPCR
jgi:hypothetical protein